MSRYTFETRLFAILRWVVIAFLVLITLVPFWYMLMMSFTPIQELQLNPGRLFPALDTLTTSTYVDVLRSREDGGRASPASCSTRSSLPP